MIDACNPSTAGSSQLTQSPYFADCRLVAVQQVCLPENVEPLERAYVPAKGTFVRLETMCRCTESRSQSDTKMSVSYNAVASGGPHRHFHPGAEVIFVPANR